MSFAGLKKQFNKANQYMSEKIGGAKGTELDDDFIEMERKTDVMGKCVDDLIGKTEEFLQPNPASRAKLRTVNTISKMRGQAKTGAYPQPEGTLGEHMCKHGKDLGEDSNFGECLIEAGESFKQLADYKYSLEDNVKQNFLEPLTHLQTKDIKEVNHHRKKLSGRRLDYDCKKRKKDKGETASKGAGSQVTDEDLRVAEEKFDESKELAETAMENLLENDVEHICQLQSFIEAQAEYHRSAMETLQALVQTLEDKRENAGNRPRRERKARPISNRSSSPDHFYEAAPNDLTNHGNGGFNYNSSSSFNSAPKPEACCEALYDFEPENEGELGFQEGDNIKLISQIDENWYEGSVNGRTGFFPVNYVKVVVDLPH